MYDLMKKARVLPRSEKIAFLEDLQEMIVLAEAPRKEVLRNMELNAIDDVNSDGFVDEKNPEIPNRRRQNRSLETKQNPDKKTKPRYVPKNYSHLNQQNSSGSFGHENIASVDNEIKVAKKIHDPETPQEIAALLSLLEKNLSVDGDLSFDSLSVFLIPLLNGSQRIGLKKHQIVGLIKRLCRLARKYQRIKKTQMSYKDKHEVRKDFNDCLHKVKTSLQIKSEFKKSINKTAQTKQINPREILRINIMNLKSMGLGPEESKKQVEKIISGLDYDAMSLLDSVISEIY